MVNCKRKNFPPDYDVHQYGAGKQVKEKQKVGQHRNFT
jgi:hypothetical protein